MLQCLALCDQSLARNLTENWELKATLTVSVIPLRNSLVLVLAVSLKTKWREVSWFPIDIFIYEVKSIAVS